MIDDSKARKPAPDDGETDFVFRFKIDPADAGKGMYDDPLTELIRRQLAALLEVVVLTRGGEEVRGIDGFKYMKHLDRPFRIYPDES